MVIALILVSGSVNDGMRFGSIPYPSSVWVLASDVDGVDDGVHEYGVTYDGSVVHHPDIDQSSVWVDVVVRVVGVVL